MGVGEGRMRVGAGGWAGEVYEFGAFESVALLTLSSAPPFIAFPFTPFAPLPPLTLLVATGPLDPHVGFAVLPSPVDGRMGCIERA